MMISSQTQDSYLPMAMLLGATIDGLPLDCCRTHHSCGAPVHVLPPAAHQFMQVLPAVSRVQHAILSHDSSEAASKPLRCTTLLHISQVLPTSRPGTAHIQARYCPYPGQI